MIGVFVGFPRIFLQGILIFKGLTARRFYKSFGVKGLLQRGIKQLVVRQGLGVLESKTNTQHQQGR
jgi:hypothetical protein